MTPKTTATEDWFVNYSFYGEMRQRRCSTLLEAEEVFKSARSNIGKGVDDDSLEVTHVIVVKTRLSENVDTDGW